MTITFSYWEKELRWTRVAYLYEHEKKKMNGVFNTELSLKTHMQNNEMAKKVEKKILVWLCENCRTKTQ